MVGVIFIIQKNYCWWFAKQTFTPTCHANQKWPHGKLLLTMHCIWKTNICFILQTNYTTFISLQNVGYVTFVIVQQDSYATPAAYKIARFTSFAAQYLAYYVTHLALQNAGFTAHPAPRQTCYVALLALQRLASRHNLLRRGVAKLLCLLFSSSIVIVVSIALLLVKTIFFLKIGWLYKTSNGLSATLPLVEFAF